MKQARHRWILLAALATAIYGLGNLYQPTVVVGQSMSPALKNGRVIWVDRTYYKNHRPRCGEVVVFKLDGETYVKRVYRGPDEMVYYISDGSEWVSPVRDSRLSEVRKRYASVLSQFSIRELRVPSDSVFVIGDNYEVSEDSRQLGPIPIANLIGRARLKPDATRTLPYEYGTLSYRQRLKHLVPPQAGTLGVRLTASQADSEDTESPLVGQTQNAL
jgi:signal peptidase I